MDEVIIDLFDTVALRQPPWILTWTGIIVTPGYTAGFIGVIIGPVIHNGRSRYINKRDFSYGGPWPAPRT